MNFLKQHITLAGFFILLTGIYSPVLSQQKTVKFGVGYKKSVAAIHKNLMHSGRYFYVGYGINYGKKMNNHFQFQVANSNKEVHYDLPYVSASTSIDVSQEFNFPIYNGKKSSFHFGPFIANSITLNFFPIIDNKNFIWENQTMTGISSRNSFKINGTSSVDLNFQLPLFSTFLSHRFNRLDRQAPESELSNWEVMDKQIGFVNRLFKPKFELGYTNKLFQSFNYSIVFQTELDLAKRQSGFRSKTQAHSLSLRIRY